MGYPEEVSTMSALDSLARSLRAVGVIVFTITIVLAVLLYLVGIASKSGSDGLWTAAAACAGTALAAALAVSVARSYLGFDPGQMEKGSEACADESEQNTADERSPASAES